MGSPDSVSATMLLNSLIPAVCLLLVSNSHGLGLQGLKEQKAREGKKQVGLPCKTIVTEECSEKEVPRFEEECEWYSEQCETEYVNECAQVPAKHCNLTPGAEEGVDAVKVCRQVHLAKVEKVCAKVESLVC